MSAPEPHPAEAPMPPRSPQKDQPQTDEYARSSKSGKFRFKSSRSSRSSKRSDPYDRDETRHRHSRRHGHERRHDHEHRSGHGHEHRHKHHSRSTKRHTHKYTHTHLNLSPTPDSSHPSQPPSGLSPDAAFRESLFDALGDDEGAAYWETVYGQPIHNFAVPSVPKGPQGELEQMDEEEYAAYVRTRMWERTREGMIEEQERLRAERARQKRREERGTREARERDRFEREMEESLRRGQARRRLKAWKAAWEEYGRSWEVIDKVVADAAAADPAANMDDDKGKEKGSEDGRNRLRNLLFWPVETGKRKDVSRDAVEEFMRHAPAESPDGKSQAGSADLLATLKSERVRWHPDKIQHRYGSLGAEEAVMRSVTEVFQIIDTMWNGLKGKQS